MGVIFPGLRPGLQETALQAEEKRPRRWPDGYKYPMAEPRPQPPVLLVVAAFSRFPEALAWARTQLESTHGPVALVSEPFPFHQTAYYQATMGPDLRKQFLAFENLVLPDCLVAAKLHSNALEQQLATEARFPEARPLNLDPGILSLGKFQLATTKDQAHRVYLGQGIFTEVTLRFQDKAWEPWPWTYADYRETTVRAFLGEARRFYKQRLGQVFRKNGL